MSAEQLYQQPLPHTHMLQGLPNVSFAFKLLLISSMYLAVAQNSGRTPPCCRHPFQHPLAQPIYEATWSFHSLCCHLRGVDLWWTIPPLSWENDKNAEIKKLLFTPMAQKAQQQQKRVKQLSVSNLTELFLKSWKLFLFQTWKNNMKNISFFQTLYDRWRKPFHITVVFQGTALILTILTAFILWVLIQLNLNYTFYLCSLERGD